MVFISLTVFLISLIMLVKGSDFFVESAARLAKQIGVSNFVIGLTVVAVGTSLPELATSIVASFFADPGIVVGNVVGSNIANIGLVVGICALFVTLKTEIDWFKFDAPFLIIVSFLFFTLALNGIFSRSEGLLFLVLFIFYMFYTLSKKKKPVPKEVVNVFLKETFDVQKIPRLKRFQDISRGGLDYEKYKEITTNIISLVKKSVKKKILHTGRLFREEKTFVKYFFKQITVLLVGLLMVVFGADFFVQAAVDLALFMRLPQTIVGFTIVALGTSLPELVVSIASIRKGLANILLGNIIGSNISNILLVAGVAAIINPIAISSISMFLLIPFMLFMTILFLSFARYKLGLDKIGGLTVLLLYLLFAFFILSTQRLL